MKYFFTFLIISILGLSSAFKLPLFQFYKKIGGKNYDASSDVIRVSAGGWLLAGRSNSYGLGDMDMNIVRVDANGNTLWNKHYGGEETEEAFAAVETKDGGFLVVGSSDTYGKGIDMKDMWVIRLDKNGNKLWQKIYGSAGTIEEAHAVVQAENGYVIAGTAIYIKDGTSDAVLLKIDDEGNQIWRKTIGNRGNEQAAELIVTKEGFAVVGNKESVMEEDTLTGRITGSRWDIWLFNTDHNGTMKWEKTYGGGDTEMGSAIVQTPDGGFALAGYTYSFAEGSHDAWVIKTNAKGEKIWTKVFGGLSTDEAFDIIATPDNSLFVTGYTDIFSPDSNGRNEDRNGNNIWVAMINAAGKEMWSKTFGGEGAQRAYSLLDNGNDLIIAGYTDEDPLTNTDNLIMKVSKTGAILK